MMLRRAYSVIDVKSIVERDNFYEISGVATTPSPDRMGDIVEPLGAKFAPSIPLLWQHYHDKPVGRAEFGKATKNGIPFKAFLPVISEPGALKDRIDEAVQSIQYRLVAAVSIGFRVLNDAIERLKDGGLRFLETEIIELSLVTIPAQTEATIHNVKSIDTACRAANGPSGRNARGPIRLDSPPPGAPGATQQTPKRTEPEEGKQMNVQEMIKALEAKRAALAAKLEAVQTKAASENRGKDAAEQEEFDNASADIEACDRELADLKKMEKLVATKATPVVATGSQPGGDLAAAQRQAAQSRGGSAVIVDRKLAPGVGFARYAGIMAASKGSISDAIRMAKDRFPDETRLHSLIENHGRINEMVGKAATDIGITTDSDYAAPLVYAQNLVSEFLEYLRPQTIVGRIPNLRRVPFNVRVPRQTSGGSASWVGEAKPKGVTSTALDYVELKYKKLATIAVISDELARFSSPSAELIIRDTLAGAIVQQMDADFVDPDNSGTSNVKPASITNGVTPVASSGDTEDRVREDVRAIFAPFIAANLSPRNGVWIMSATNALSLSLMVNALGQTAFPGITMDGGTFFGMPVVVSEAVGNIVILANASDILVADDGGVTIDTSREASVQMDSAPDDPSTASTVYVSLWQRNLLGIRAERFIDWVKGRTAAVQYLSGVEWGLEST